MLRTACFLTLCAAAAYGDNYQRQPSIDVQHYVFRVELTDSGDEMAGETTVTVRFMKDGVGSFWLEIGRASGRERV